MRFRCPLGIRLILGFAFVLLAGYAEVSPGAAADDAPASLTISVYTCDHLHDPIDPNQTLANKYALGTEDIPFSLQPAAPQGGSMIALPPAQVEALPRSHSRISRRAIIGSCRKPLTRSPTPMLPNAPAVFVPSTTPFPPLPPSSSRVA